MKKAIIVLGAGFGDEGKGLMTDYFCTVNPNSIVIRFSGGGQAGHTVVMTDGRRHIFSQLGSGTLRSRPTFWSKHCTFDPLGFVKEFDALQNMATVPGITVWLDNLAPVTTPYDVYFNRAIEKRNGHGSCGLGFGTTVERHENSHYRIYAQDLLHPEILETKLFGIRKYYNDKIGDDTIFREKLYKFDEVKVMSDFLEAVKICKRRLIIVSEEEFFNNVSKRFDAVVFEGSQGIMLDMDFGFFPNVTRSNTTSKNAIALIEKYVKPKPINPNFEIEVCYVTRAYQTRHGNGPMSNEGMEIDLINNPNETNKYNEWQGHFKKAPLDVDLLNYAFDCDANFVPYKDGFDMKRSIAFTCLDQIIGDLIYTSQGNTHKVISIDVINGIRPTMLKHLRLKADNVYLSNSDCSDKIIKLNNKIKVTNEN